MSMNNLALDVESIALALSEEGGYEYYHIDDDLKELAKNVSDMQAENARLRERVDAAHMSRLLTENENESLRDLVRDVYTLHWNGLDCTECPWFDECDTTGGCPWLSIFADRMRELGVEVD